MTPWILKTHSTGSKRTHPISRYVATSRMCWTSHQEFIQSRRVRLVYWAHLFHCQIPPGGSLQEEIMKKNGDFPYQLQLPHVTWGFLFKKQVPPDIFSHQNNPQDPWGASWNHIQPELLLIQRLMQKTSHARGEGEGFSWISENNHAKRNTVLRETERKLYTQRYTVCIWQRIWLNSWDEPFEFIRWDSSIQVP